MARIERIGEITKNTIQIIHQGTDKDCVGIIGPGVSLVINRDDILYITQSKNRLEIKIAGSAFRVAGRMRNIIREFEEPFYLCHAYLMVNISRIEAMSDKCIYFSNSETKIYLGRDNYAKTLKAFKQYLTKTSTIL